MGSPLLGFTARDQLWFKKKGKPGKEEVPCVSCISHRDKSSSLERSSTHLPVIQTMLTRLVLFGWMIFATSGRSVMRSGRSVVMTRVERVCSGSNQCLPFSSCPTLQGRNKQDTLQTIRQLQCGFSGSSPMVCCPPSLPRKAVEGGGNPAVLNVNVNVDVNSRTNLDIGGLNARTGSFPLSQEETTLWSEEFGPK